VFNGQMKADLQCSRMMAEFSPGLFGTNCEVWWWWNNDVGCFFYRRTGILRKVSERVDARCS